MASAGSRNLYEMANSDVSEDVCCTAFLELNYSKNFINKLIDIALEKGYWKLINILAKHDYRLYTLINTQHPF